MYVDTDAGHVAVPGGYKMSSEFEGMIAEEFPFRGNSELIHLDPHVVPIVYTLTQKGYKTVHSCGGHLNTREIVDPVEVGLDLSYKEANDLAEWILSRVRTMQANDMDALDRITVKALPRRSTLLNFFHVTDPLFDEMGLEPIGSIYHADYGERKFDRRVVPEVYLEWNKTIMVMQVMVAILSRKEKAPESRN